MENNLIKIHQIEKEKKLDKLKEELNELNHSITDYENNAHIYPVLKELADVMIIILGIAIVKHGISIKEFIAILKQKVNRSVKIKKKMDETKQSYNKIRGEYD